MVSSRSAQSLACLLLALGLVLSGCLATTGSGAPDHSANYSESLALRQMPPPHERGIGSMALLYRPYPKVGVLNDRRDAGLYMYGAIGAIVAGVADSMNQDLHEADAETVIAKDFLETRFFAEGERAPHVRLQRLTAEEARLAHHVIDEKGFYEARSFDETGKRVLAALKARGIDAVVLVDEQQTVKTAEGDMPSKGLYQAHNRPRVVAGFRFSLIDTATGEEVEDSGFVQVSYAQIDLPYFAPLEQYSPFELREIRLGLERRTVNNVLVMLRLLKVIPGPDGKF